MKGCLQSLSEVHATAQTAHATEITAQKHLAHHFRRRAKRLEVAGRILVDDRRSRNSAYDNMRKTIAHHVASLESELAKTETPSGANDTFEDRLSRLGDWLRSCTSTYRDLFHHVNVVYEKIRSHDILHTPGAPTNLAEDLLDAIAVITKAFSDAVVDERNKASQLEHTVGEGESKLQTLAADHAHIVEELRETIDDIQLDEARARRDAEFAWQEA